MRLGASLSTVQAEPQLPDLLLATDTLYAPNNAFYWDYTITVNRDEAMQVPAIARARNILCATAGSLAMSRYNALTGERISNTPLLYQPDPNSPRCTTWTWVYDSLYFHGRAFMQVLETYQDDGRPSRARWIDPMRVTPLLNDARTEAIGYYLDGVLLPTSGVGSLIYFPGADEGILARGGYTIRTAIALERAAKRAAEEPTPQTVLKSTGVDLPSEKITELLTKWKESRNTRATAYLYSGLDMQAIGFDPRSQQLVEARQYIAAEIARLSNIPAWYLGAETNSMTYSNIESERRSLVDTSLLPYLLKPVEDRLSMIDLTPRAVEVRADLSEFLRGSALEQVEVIERMIQANLITVEEGRAMMNLASRGNTDAN